MKLDFDYHCPVAIVGMGAIFPGSDNITSFWNNIFQGRDLFTDVPRTHWLIDDYHDPDAAARDKTYGKRGGFIPDVNFEPMVFGMPPNTIEATDTIQLLSLMVARQVLEDAYQDQFDNVDKSRISVVLGTTGATELIMDMASRLERPKWVTALRQEGLDEAQVQSVCDRIAAQYVEWQESTFPGLLGNVVAGRIAHRLNLGGTNFVTDAACASSFAALSMSLNELYLGHSDLVITGGADALNTISMFMCFSKTPALSPTGDCRPFSDKADGTMLGEGVGMFAIKRLEDAQRDGDKVYAVIKGLGSSSDGIGKSVYAPVAEGQAVCLQRAYKAAGYEPETVEMLEAHGTGTKAGDVAELEGLSRVFKHSVSKKNWCALGSIKANIGHTKAASGAAGMMKAVLSLNHKVLPPSIKINKPNPKLDIENSAFYLNTQARPWIRNSRHPRRAGVSSFGFGGTNFHITLEEYPSQQSDNNNAIRAPRCRTFDTELFLFSAENPNELSPSKSIDDETFRYLAQQSQQHFNIAHTYRLAIVATDARDLELKLSRSLKQIAAKPEQNFDLPNGCRYGVGPQRGKLAFIFSGQGSQYVNMGADLAMHFDCARQVWDRCGDVDAIMDGVGNGLDQDTEPLHLFIFPRPVFEASDRQRQEQILKQTQWAQPAIVATSLAQLNIMNCIGMQASMLAGHSLGELTALHASQVFNADTLLRIAKHRGQLFEHAATVPGGMLAVMGDRTEIESFLVQTGSDVVVANYNSPQQVILSGTVDGINHCQSLLEGAGYRVNMLDVSVANHSSLVAPAVAPFKNFLDHIEFNPAVLPVFSNLDGQPFPEEAAVVRQQLSRQIEKPVQFVSQIDAMYASGARTFVEIGPGSVLTGLVHACLADREHEAIAVDPKGKQDGVTNLWLALAKLASLGYNFNLNNLLGNYESVPDPSSQPTPTIGVTINGANYGKPYPPGEGNGTVPKPNRRDNNIKNGIKRSEQEQASILMATKDETAPAVDQPTRASRWIDGKTMSEEKIMKNRQAKNQAATGLSPPSSLQSERLTALQASQQTMLKAQIELQKSMIESHRILMKALEGSVQQMGIQPSDERAVGQIDTSAPQPPTLSSPDVTTMVPIPPEPPGQAVSEEPTILPPENTAPDIPAKPKVSMPSDIDIRQVILDVVADKTGYPIDMLTPDMHIENDLGIDSIKRVEILSGVVDRVPDLPELDNHAMAKRSTLEEIVQFINANMMNAAPVVRDEPETERKTEARTAQMDTSATKAKLPAAGERSAPTAGIDIRQIMLDVVADKTGYPVDMLTPDMHLENDLGIDSIKRVEILSGTVERVPELPELDNHAMAKLSTLTEIITHIDQVLGNGNTVPPEPPAQQESQDVGVTKAEIDIPRPKIDRFVLHWQASSPLGLSAYQLEADDPIVISQDNRGVAKALAKQFTELGYQAHVCQTNDDARIAEAKAVLYINGLNEVSSADDAIAINVEAFSWAIKVAEKFSLYGGLFVTVQDTGGKFLSDVSAENLSHAIGHRALLGGLTGLAKTAAIEWPAAQVKAIDMDQAQTPPTAVAKRLLAEVLLGGLETEVGLTADHGRGTLICESMSAGTDRAPDSAPDSAIGFESPFSPNPVIVASGGARGVTAASLIALAEKMPIRLVLLGRTPLFEEAEHTLGVTDDGDLEKALLDRAKHGGYQLNPVKLQRQLNVILANREIKKTLAKLKTTGAQVCYEVCDVREKDKVDSIMAKIRSDWGAVHGIVHGAGVIADKRIADKTNEELDRVVGTKIAGLLSLLDATRSDPLEFICLFSSVAGRTGNQGQADYAMANEMLNKLAVTEYYRRKGQCLIKAINWGPWDGGMVNPALKQQFVQAGVPLITLEVGSQFFVRELTAGDATNIEVVIGGCPYGHSLLPINDRREQTLAITLSEQEYHFLTEHSIHNKPVVPLMLVADWVIRSCRSKWPHLYLESMTQLQCHKGIVIDDFGLSLELSLKEKEIASESLGSDNPKEIKFTLKRHDILYYSGTVALAAYPGKDRPKELSVGKLDAWPDNNYYDSEALFHKTLFKVIENIDGSSVEGLQGSLAVQSDLSQQQTHMLLFDGGIQLALLWVWHYMFAGSLPMKMEVFRVYRSSVNERCSCTLKVRAATPKKTIVDMTFFDASNETIADIRGLELITYFDKNGKAPSDITAGIKENNRDDTI